MAADKRIIEKLAEVRTEIKRAAKAANRDPEQIKLLAAAKQQPASHVATVANEEAIIGENRLKELKQHQQQVSKLLEDEEIEWHFIGHLQRNKVHKVLPRVSLIHSLDSERLAQRINRVANREKITANCLVQINIGQEKTKYGIAPDKLFDFVQSLLSLEQINMRGLMCIPPYFPDQPEKTRPYFSRMKHLAQEVKDRYQREKKIELNYLSMGMSNDFKQAIACGSNLVRIGRAIFGSRN